MEPKRFYRSKTDRVFAGVCGGLAQYFSMDPLLIRLLLVVLAMVGGGGILIYIILWIVAPEKQEPYTIAQEPAPMGNPEPPRQAPPQPEPPHNFENSPQGQPPYYKRKYRRPHRGLIGGLVLITLGVLFLVAEFVPSVDFGDLWPILLVVIGIGLLIRSVSGRRENN